MKEENRKVKENRRQDERRNEKRKEDEVGIEDKGEKSKKGETNDRKKKRKEKKETRPFHCTECEINLSHRWSERGTERCNEGREEWGSVCSSE